MKTTTMRLCRKTNPFVKIVDFVSKISNVGSQVFAVLFGLCRFHRLTSGSRAELLYLLT